MGPFFFLFLSLAIGLSSCTGFPDQDKARLISDTMKIVEELLIRELAVPDTSQPAPVSLPHMWN